MAGLQSQNPGGSSGQLKNKFITVPLHAIFWVTIIGAKISVKKSKPSYTMLPVSWKQLPTTPTMRKQLHSLIGVTLVPQL